MALNTMAMSIAFRRALALQGLRAPTYQYHTQRCLASFASTFSSIASSNVQSRGISTKGSSSVSAQSNQSSSLQLDQTSAEGRMQRLSAAMDAYLQRKKEVEQFMEKQAEEFELGKKHLANMMGLRESDMTQEIIDDAIKYLLPSGLFDEEARPFMRPPEEIFPRQKAAQFDIKGRPHHFLFYTVTPVYFEILHNITNHMTELDKFQDRLIKKGILEPPPEAKAFLGNSTWLSYEEMKDMILEKIDEDQYKYMIRSLDRLAEHPYSGRVVDFIQAYRKKLVAVTAEMSVPEMMYDEEGRPYMIGEGRQKTAASRVIVRGNGTGKVIVHNEGKTYDLLYFENIKEREQVMWPLVFCDLLWKVDLEIWVEIWKKNHHKRYPMEAWSAKSKATRYALSMALRPFVDKFTVEKMRLAGLLTPDIRYRERKKPGQPAARAKYTWKKR